MRLATLRRGGGTTAARLDGETFVEIEGSDVGELLRRPDWRSTAADAGGSRHPAADADLAPVVPRPGKIVCVGLNYRNHILEMGRELPAHPTLFAKYPEALVGPRDAIVLPAVSDAVDWEAELAVIVGSPLRHADADESMDAIAGYAVLNDVTARDYQYRTSQWLQGKTFEATTPLGPCLVTPDEFVTDSRMTCTVNGELMQDTTVDGLVFGVGYLLSYVSQILTLQPGDVIATGTPGGVGHARTPPHYLRAGDTLVTAIEGLGELVNTARAERL